MYKFSRNFSETKCLKTQETNNVHPLMLKKKQQERWNIHTTMTKAQGKTKDTL